MISYTCSDIIKQAKRVANVSNVNMSNFELATSLLNQEYQKLYDKIVVANGAYIKEEHFSSDRPYIIPEEQMFFNIFQINLPKTLTKINF